MGSSSLFLSISSRLPASHVQTQLTRTDPNWGPRSPYPQSGVPFHRVRAHSLSRVQNTWFVTIFCFILAHVIFHGKYDTLPTLAVHRYEYNEYKCHSEHFMLTHFFWINRVVLGMPEQSIQFENTCHRVSMIESWSVSTGLNGGGTYVEAPLSFLRLQVHIARLKYVFCDVNGGLQKMCQTVIQPK